MLSDLEKRLKANLKITYVKELGKVIYSIEYKGKIYQKTFPTEEVIQHAQRAINQDVLEEKDFFFLKFIQETAKKIEQTK